MQKRSTILPLDKDLVPTDHVWKVRGKEFTAVNIEVKEGQPIPAHLINVDPSNRGQVITTETVYEIVPRNQSLNTLNSYNNMRQTTSIGSVYAPGQTSIMQPIYVQRPSRISEPFLQQNLSVPRSATPIRVSGQTNFSNNLRL